jgi:hypothetical protein
MLYKVGMEGYRLWAGRLMDVRIVPPWLREAYVSDRACFWFESFESRLVIDGGFRDAWWARARLGWAVDAYLVVIPAQVNKNDLALLCGSVTASQQAQHLAWGPGLGLRVPGSWVRSVPRLFRSVHGEHVAAR